MKRLVLFSVWLLPALAAAACFKELAVAENGAGNCSCPTSRTSTSMRLCMDAGLIWTILCPIEAGPPPPSETPDADKGGAPSIVGGDGATVATTNCNRVEAAQTVVTLADIGGQWVSVCDPLPFVQTAFGPSEAGVDLPTNTAGFEIDPTSHLLYALVPVVGSYARVTGDGSVWWANDVNPYGVLPDGGPQEYLLVTNANLFDGGRYTRELHGWGILYYPARDGGVRSLTLLNADAGTEVTLLPPEVVPSRTH